MEVEGGTRQAVWIDPGNCYGRTHSLKDGYVCTHTTAEGGSRDACSYESYMKLTVCTLSSEMCQVARSLSLFLSLFLSLSLSLSLSFCRLCAFSSLGLNKSFVCIVVD